MKILVRVPNWLGDVVMSTAFIAAVKQLYPDSTIDIIIKSELKGIASLIPGIDQIIPFSKKEFNGLSGVFRFGKALRPQKYDIFFSLPDSISSAVMGWATGAKTRVGFGKEGGFFLLTKIAKKPKNAHRVDEYISLLEQFTGKAIDNRQVKSNTDPNLPKNNLVLVNFNSEAESRRMPLGTGINLINKLTSTFKDANFAFIGAPKEADYVNQLIINSEHASRLQNYAGKTNLAELANLMAASTVLLTTDSGPAHLANSVGIPVIALFGAGNEFNTGPYNKNNLTILRANQLDCEPCVRNTCKLYGTPKCMELLDEFQIIGALKDYLNTTEV
jgi:lipopolysaccharide heptosyltransferase II